VPFPGTQASQLHTTTPRLRNHVVQWFVRDLSSFLSCYSTVFVVALLSLLLCVLLLHCVLVCVLTPSLTQILIMIILCKVWETPTCGDSSQTGWDIRKNTVALKFDLWVTWEGLSATLDQSRSSQLGVCFCQTTRKIGMSLVHFSLLRFMSSLVLKLHLRVYFSLLFSSKLGFSSL
jgi:hypothetical protein